MVSSRHSSHDPRVGGEPCGESLRTTGRYHLLRWMTRPRCSAARLSEMLATWSSDESGLVDRVLPLCDHADVESDIEELGRGELAESED